MSKLSFVHTADLHLGEPVRGWKWDKQDMWKRHSEHLETFRRIITLVKQRAVPFLLIAGDFLEHGYVTSSLYQDIIDQFSRIPDTRIFISPGNHDPFRLDSIYRQKSWPDHVHIFGPKWEELFFSEYNFRLCGRGFSDFSEREFFLPENKKSSAKYSIYLMHGDFRVKQQNSSYFPIDEDALEMHQVDYVALGHIHKSDTYKLGEFQPIIVHYPGSPEAHNWKELGIRTITIGKIDERGVTIEQTAIHTRSYEQVDLDITGLSERKEIIHTILTLIKSLPTNCYGIIRLIGRSALSVDDFSWFQPIKNQIEKNYKWIILDDHTIPEYDLAQLRSQGQLIGTFIDLLEEKIAMEQDLERQKVYQLALFKGLDAFWRGRSAK